jgi:hypothetical protein
MSKERELLIRIVDNDKTCGLFFLTPKFKEQIKELLAQPETMSGEWWYVKGVEDTKFFLKRKPLPYEHLEALVDKHHGYPMVLGRAIEEAHGIGGTYIGVIP